MLPGETALVVAEFAQAPGTGRRCALDSAYQCDAPALSHRHLL